MNPGAGFWDSSALSALFVQERTSVQARALVRKFEPVVWWGTIVEIRSAIARQYRSGDLSDATRRTVVDRLATAQGGWYEIRPTDELRELAINLLDRYALRAADGLQLAAAMTWCHRRPAGRKFICQDVRLCEAAADADFDVVQL